MKNPTWPKVFAFAGLALIGLVVAIYAATVSSAGITAWFAGMLGGNDVLAMGNAAILVGMAVMAAFGYLALRGYRSLSRR